MSGQAQHHRQKFLTKSLRSEQFDRGQVQHDGRQPDPGSNFDVLMIASYTKAFEDGSADVVN